MTEALMKKPYWIVDILPFRVPEDSPGQYFSVEKYFVETRIGDIRRRRLNVILKLNCYLDIVMDGETNPPPEKIAEIMNTGHVCIMIGNAMILFEPDDTHMTVFDPDERLLALVKEIAASEGLFVWQPPQAGFS